MPAPAIDVLCIAASQSNALTSMVSRVAVLGKFHIPETVMASHFLGEFSWYE